MYRTTTDNKYLIAAYCLNMWPIFRVTVILMVMLLMVCSAVEVGVDMLELDCHMTKDGEVVVCHDEDLTRVTGHSVRISDTLLKVTVRCFFLCKILYAHSYCVHVVYYPCK